MAHPARIQVHNILRDTSQEEMIENRRKCSTGEQYGTRIRRMVQFINNRFPEVNDLINGDNWLKRHVPMDVMKELIAEFNEREGVDSYSTYVSRSTFGGFVSTFSTGMK